MPWLFRLTSNRSVWIAAISLPALALAVLMVRYGVFFPFWDQWELVTQIRHYNDHTLSWADLWVQHNEHRIFFPRLIMMGLAVMTRWHVGAEIATNLVLALTSFVVVTLLLRRTFGTLEPRYQAAIAAATAWLWFSPVQWENWLWGWQIQWFLSILGLVLAIWALAAWPRAWRAGWALPAATLGAITATYSLGNGFLVWVAGLIPLLLQRRGRRTYTVWVTSAVAALALYYYHYQDPNPAERLLWLKEPLAYAGYVLAYLGGVFAVGFVQLAVVAGAGLSLIFCGSLIYLWRYDRPALLRLGAWIGLAVYAILSACLGGIARLDLGVSQAVSSRYTTVSQLMVIATAILAGHALRALHKHHRSRQPQILAISKAVIISACIILGVVYLRGILAMDHFQRSLSGTQACMRAATPQSCLLKAYPNQNIIWDRLQYLRSIHWGGL